MSRQAKGVFQEIERRLQARVTLDPEYKRFREKTTKLEVLGLRLPVMQEIEESGFSFYDEPQDKILNIWQQIWNAATIHEVMYLPLFYYRRHRQELGPLHWKMMKQWINRVENWEHADALCQLYSILYERNPKRLLPTLRQWNRSSNPWKRRASIVSTIYYASPRRKAPTLKTVLSLVKPLILDKNAYVQKAVGWQLREAYKLWPKESLVFLKKHTLDLSATSFSYATERLPKNQRNQFKERRHLERKK